MALALLALLLASTSGWAQNKALKLDGRGSYVELPPDIFKDLTQATVEVWAKWDAFRGYSRVFDFGAPWHSMSLFNHETTPDLRFNLYPGNAQFDASLRHHIRAPGLLRTNEWIHLAAVSGPLGMKLYANGVLVGKHSNTASFAQIRATQTNYIGRGLVQNATDRDFRGEIDELRVWDHRRNTAQIRESMFKRLSGNEPGLIHLWNFDDGTANDSASSAHGKLLGKARVAGSDLALVSSVAPGAIEPAPPATNIPAVAPAVIVPSGDSRAATWWIAASLSAIAALLAWLLLMLRRSGLGSQKLVTTTSIPLLPPGVSGSAEDVKERTVAELTDFAKQSLVQGLYSQRAALLDVQKKAQQELADLEARLVALHLPDRIEAYEKRIAQLEKQLETRNDELGELTQATLLVLRQKLEEEKQSQRKNIEFN